MPAHVARINVVTDPVTGEMRGLPSKSMMDWEEFQHNFNGSALASLDTRITTVESTSEGGTASGAIYFAAKSTPAGATAAYGLYLTAGAAFAGFEVLALSAGGSAINMTADKLMFSDSGTATAVFDYGVSTPGVFTFNVPVQINTADIGSRAVSNVAAASGAVGTGSVQTVSLTTRAGAEVVILAAITDASPSLYLASFSASFPVRTFNIEVDGSAVATLDTTDVVVASNFLGGSSYAFYKAVCPTTQSYNVTGLSAGAHTFAIRNSTAGTIGLSVVAIEHAR